MHAVYSSQHQHISNKLRTEKPTVRTDLLDPPISYMKLHSTFLGNRFLIEALHYWKFEITWEIYIYIYIYMTFFQRKLFRRHMESGEYYRFSMCFGLSLMPTFTFMTILHAHFLDSTTRQVIYSNRTKPFWIREIVPCAPKGKGDKSS